jgi:hypothetical protein
MTSYVDRVIFWKVVLVLTPFSAVASLSIVIFILLFLRHDFPSRLILNLSLADFGLSIICAALCGFNLYNGDLQPPSGWACIIQPFITWYFMEASILILSTIAISSMLWIKFNRSFGKKEEIIAYCICWGVPFITALLPLINGTGEAYGDRNNLWCSFADNQKKAQLWNIWLYYGINLINIAGCYLVIVHTVWKMYSNRIDHSNLNDKLSVTKRLFAFVFCYFIVWTPLAICYVYEEATGQYVSYVVEIIVDNLLHVQGILNFLIYGLNRNVIRLVRKKYNSSKESRSSITLEEAAVK